MSINYYLTIYPTEALIASMHSPEKFGAYMSNGESKVAAERLIFAEIKPGFEGINWAHAQEKCVEKANGEAKNSVYLSVYRAFEKVPFEAIGALYLTTRDGRTLKLDQAKYTELESPYHVYQELTPVHPLVASKLEPKKFAEYLVKEATGLQLPRIAFADLKVLNFEDLEHTGNIGSLYDHNVRHLKSCVKSVTEEGSTTKTIDRAHIERFSFNIIKSGIFISDGDEMLYYPMPSAEEVKQLDYDWGRSALVY